MSIKQLSQSDLTRNTLELSSTAPIPQRFSKKRMLVLAVLSVLLLLLSSTAVAAPGDDFPDEPIAPEPDTPIAVVPTYVKLPNNTACFAGQHLRGLRPDLTDKWYPAVEIDLSTDGLYSIPLVASNRYTIGTGYVINLGNFILVNFVINGTPESDAFHSFVNSIATEPDPGSDAFQTADVFTLLINQPTDIEPTFDFAQDGRNIAILFNIWLSGKDITNMELFGKLQGFFANWNGCGVGTITQSELITLFDGWLADCTAPQTSTTDIQEPTAEDNGDGEPQNEAIDNTGEGKKDATNPDNQIGVPNADVWLEDYPEKPSAGTNQSAPKDILQELYDAYFKRPPGEQYNMAVKIANGVELKGGFVTLFKDPKQLTKEAIDDIDTAVANIKRGVPTALPANSGLFGELIDISGIAGDSPSIWLMPIELVSYKTTSPAIGGPFNGAEPINNTFLPLP